MKFKYIFGICIALFSVFSSFVCISLNAKTKERVKMINLKKYSVQYDGSKFLEYEEVTYFNKNGGEDSVATIMVREQVTYEYFFYNKKHQLESLYVFNPSGEHLLLLL